MPNDRAESSYRVRLEAAELARHRTHPRHQANPDEERYAAARYPLSFTKGLKHCQVLGVVENRAHFEAFRHAIDNAFIEPFSSFVPVPTDENCRRRQWEAPTAGVAFDLQGPDAQAVTMPPAPELGSDELAFEMAEVYELALLRDVPFSSFHDDDGKNSKMLGDSIQRLNDTAYAKSGFPGRPRKTDAGGKIFRQTAFRGSSPGVETGPYVSQFLWIGNEDPANGRIAYGAQVIEQRVPVAEPGLDYMQLWDDWLKVQDGLDVNHCGMGRKNNKCGVGQNLNDKRRFIWTPRDLATYVHFDALYQAYLNATLILLGMGTPFDPGFAHLSGMRDMYNPLGHPDPAVDPGRRLNAGGFALYGGPHILTLVTEVATRALKAVRFQKFNNHLRLRPEALAGRMEKASELDAEYSFLCGAFTEIKRAISPTIAAIEKKNKGDAGQATSLLPMAFAEGSPMHPTYGAGHATVAGACTTIVKAFFDTGTCLGKHGGSDPCAKDKIGFFHDFSEPVHYIATQNGSDLVQKKSKFALTLEGELNKLAANISIGRNMAGVHFFSDYYDSLRMGEEIAIGMLEEQALCYPTDDFVLSVPTFDGNIVRIGRK